MPTSLALLTSGVFIITGLISLISPATGWWLSTGWQFRDAEPSAAALVIARIGGIGAIIAGIFVAFHHN